VIALRRVSKVFRLYSRPIDRLLEWVLPVQRHQAFHALRDINLEIPSGRTVGIVGVNGAGKSTLLKLITGVLLPTDGTIEVSGRVAALLELGTGFHPEFSGRQNIHVNGQLMGLSLEEVKALEAEIIEFSELGAFIDQPIRTYSSGMYLRLGFSIAAALRPDVLIVDEALSVGDARFSQKCIRRIREFRDAGTTILFVSHDPGAIATLCDEAVLLDRGMVRTSGTPKEVLEEYNALLATLGGGNRSMVIARPARLSSDGVRRHGVFTAIVSAVDLLNGEGTATDVFSPGEEMTVRIRVDFLIPAHNPTIGFSFRDRFGQDLYGTNTALKQFVVGSFQPGDFAVLEVRVVLPIGYGDYSLTVAVHSAEDHLDACFEWADNAAVFRIRLKDRLDWSGLLRLDPTLRLERGHSEPVALRQRIAERFPALLDPLPMEDVPPSPWLTGFTPCDHGRAFATGATCLFVPRFSELLLRLRLAHPMEFNLRIDGMGTVLNATCPNGEVTLATSLPEDALGEHLILTLEHSAAGEAPILLGLQTSEKREAPEGWPSIQPK
jgi:lipopolysaccharide transport system ATP-binding protein